MISAETGAGLVRGRSYALFLSTTGLRGLLFRRLQGLRYSSQVKVLVQAADDRFDDLPVPHGLNGFTASEGTLQQA